MHHLSKRVHGALRRTPSDRARLADPQPARGTTPSTARTREPDAEAVLQGDQRLRRRDRRAGAAASPSSRTTARPPAAAGSTPASTPTASTRRAGATPATSTRPGGWVSPEWAWAWPANRRILYNRASADPRGQAVVGAQEATSGGTRSRASGRATTCPTSRSTSARTTAPPTTPRAWTRSPATDPFIMMADGRGWLYAPSGPARRAAADALRAARVAGRRTLLYPEVGANPAALRWNAPGEPVQRRPATRATRAWPRRSGSPSTTPRAAMSRNLPWLAELQPEMFAEIDPVLAAERGIEDGGWMTISTARGRDRGARAGHRAHAAAAGRRARSSTRSRCRGTGASAAPAPGDATNDLVALVGRPERRRSRSPRRSPATCAPGAARGEPTARLAGVHARAPRRRARPTTTRPRSPQRRRAEIASRRPRSPSTATAPAHGLLHRHDGVHRLQGVRGRLQAVERPARRRRRRSARAAPTTTRARCRRSDLAPRALRRARPTPAGASVARGRTVRRPRRARARDARRRGAIDVAARGRRRSTTGSSCPTSASTARTPAASTPARPAR